VKSIRRRILPIDREANNSMVAIPLQVNPCNVGAVSGAENHNVSHEPELFTKVTNDRTNNMTYAGAERSEKNLLRPSAGVKSSSAQGRDAMAI
jgi:hypothetical protein